MIYNKERRDTSKYDDCDSDKCNLQFYKKDGKKFCSTSCQVSTHKRNKRAKQKIIGVSVSTCKNLRFDLPLNTESSISEKTESKKRKDAPVFSGFMQYFPNAIFEVARLSKAANEKHNPNEPLHWAKQKSNDHSDCLARHQLEVGTIDTDGFDHAVKVAWRAMAQLEMLLTENK